MQFEEHFGVKRTSADDWYNLFLGADTQLFIDPLLLASDEDPYWQAAHQRLIKFFNQVLFLLAKADLRPTSAHWQKAARLMLFPEPEEFCLGYSVGSTRGSGSGKGLGDLMLASAATAIKAGVVQVDHFEELALFGENVGADRIGDIVCNVLKAEFIKYTQQVASRHGLPMTAVPVEHARWTTTDLQWRNERLSLPLNPYNGRGVLLTPQRFLRELPQMDPNDFWAWAWSNENEQIRGDFNYKVASEVDRKEIVRLARLRPNLLRRYVQHRAANVKPAYDLGVDPSGKVRWYATGKAIAESLNLPLPSDRGDFCTFVGRIVQAFKHEIEERGGWRILWNGDDPASEKVVQALFNVIVVHYCRANDVDVSPESNAGRGPVDFKFSHGWDARAVVETKLANNSKYWDGVQVQTPQYMTSESVSCGYFVTIQYRDVDLSTERVTRVNNIAKAISEESGRNYTAVFVDARPKASASKLKRPGSAG